MSFSCTLDPECQNLNWNNVYHNSVTTNNIFEQTQTGGVEAGASASTNSGSSALLTWGSAANPGLSGSVAYHGGNPGSGCDGFTVTQPGLYLATFNVDFTNASALTNNEVLNFSIAIDQSAFNSICSVSAGQFGGGGNALKASASGSYMLSLNAGQTVGISMAFNNNGGAGASYTLTASNLTVLTLIMIKAQTS